MREQSRFPRVKWLALAALLALVVGAGATAKWSQVGAESDYPGPRECKADYNDKTIAGCFGWSSTAYMNGVTTDASAAIGLIHFDGAGNLTGWYSGDAQGVPVVRNYRGAYVVYPNGTGHLRWIDDHDNTIACDFVIVNGSNEVMCSNTQPGFIQNIHFKRQ